MNKIEFEKYSERFGTVSLDNEEFSVTTCFNQDGIDHVIDEIFELIGEEPTFKQDRTGTFRCTNPQYIERQNQYQEGVAAAYAGLKYKGD